MKNWLKEKMFKCTFFSTGKIFDPYYQKRTSSFKDLSKKSRKKTKEMLDKIFRING